MSGPIQFVSSYAASVEIAAIKCFGTEDPSGEDEPYLIISVISINPNFAGEDELVTTKIVRADNIHAGDMFAVGQTIGSAKIVAGDGLRVHMALFEHEHGSPEDVRKQIEDTIREAVKKAAQTLTTLADVPLAGSLGEVASNPIVIALTEGLSALITPLLADDQIGGEKVLPLKASQLVDLALDETKPESVQGFQKSLMTTPEIGPDIEFNFPADHEDRRWLFEGGGGSYKVYLKVIPTRNAFPVP